MFIGKHDEARNIVLAFAFGLAACCVTFVVLVLAWGPYLHLQKREKELQDAAKVHYSTMETSKNNQIKTLNDTVVVLQDGQSGLREMINALEKEKSSKANKAALAKKCFYNQLDFTQAPTLVRIPPKDQETLLFANHIKLRIHLGPSETGRIKVFSDANFNGFAEPSDVIKVGPTGGTDAEYEIYPRVKPRTSITITIYGPTPFNLVCIDRLPPIK
jgi:hypothetical protein